MRPFGDCGHPRFHRYELSKDEVDHVMDAFPLARRKDEAAFGEYRTKLAIMSDYDRRAASAAGVPE
jgi:hypothetical protein